MMGHESSFDPAAYSEIRALRARVAELERTERELRERIYTAGHAHDEELHLFKRMVDAALDSITLTSMDGSVIYANPAFKERSGFGEKAVGKQLSEFYSPENYRLLMQETVPILLKNGEWQGYLYIRRPDGTEWIGQTNAFIVLGPDGVPTGMAAVFRDVTAQIQAEDERTRMHAQVLEAQQRALRELSTPLIPIADQVIALPLIGAIDSVRAQQITETLLHGISAHHAIVAILDITGIRTIDAPVASAVLRAAQAAKLLGTEVVITGMSAVLAQAIVAAGLELTGIITLGNFQSGITYALERSKHRGATSQRGRAVSSSPPSTSRSR